MYLSLWMYVCVYIVLCIICSMLCINNNMHVVVIACRPIQNTIALQNGFVNHDMKAWKPSVIYSNWKLKSTYTKVFLFEWTKRLTIQKKNRKYKSRKRICKKMRNKTQHYFNNRPSRSTILSLFRYFIVCLIYIIVYAQRKNAHYITMRNIHPISMHCKNIYESMRLTLPLICVYIWWWLVYVLAELKLCLLLFVCFFSY